MEVLGVSEENKDINHSEAYSTSLLMDTIMIGFFGGIIWGFVAHVAHYFNFMDFNPKFILTSWTKADWVYGWLGVVMSLFIFGILSVLAGLLYYAVLKKIKSIFGGIIFGFILWVMLVFILRPMFSGVPSYSEMKTHTWITSICIFILYGLFVGYSISYEHNEIEKYRSAKPDSPSP
jgi:hypothetical protein